MQSWQKTSFPSVRRVKRMTSIWGGKKDKQGKKILNLAKHSLWFPRPATLISFLAEEWSIFIPGSSMAEANNRSPGPGALLTEYQHISSCDRSSSNCCRMVGGLWRAEGEPACS